MDLRKSNGQARLFGNALKSALGSSFTPRYVREPGVETTAKMVETSKSLGSSCASLSSCNSGKSSGKLSSNEDYKLSSSDVSTSSEMSITADRIYCTEPNSEKPDRAEFKSEKICQKNSSVDLNRPSLDCCKTFHDTSVSKGHMKSRLPSYDASYLKNLESSTGFIDSHCHVDRLLRYANFNGSYHDYMWLHEDNYPKAYKGCIAVFCDPDMFAKKYLWQKHLEQDGVWAAFGCHPKSARHYDVQTDINLEVALNHPKVKALGEIGLDYSKGNKSSKVEQHRAFRRQLRIARERNLRVVIHVRDADDDAIKIMHEIMPKDIIFHLHCFTGNWRRAQQWMSEFPNVFIGLTSLVTFPSALETHEVAKLLPLDRLLLETDAPYFVPNMACKDSKFSHPGMAIHVAAQIAAIKNIPVEKVLNWTCANTKLMYDLP